MKSTFKVDLHRNGKANDAIVRMVTNHNEGLAKIDLEIIVAYVKAKYAEFPTITPETRVELNVGKGTLDIYESDKPTISIYEKEIHELQLEENENVLNAETMLSEPLPNANTFGR